MDDITKLKDIARAVKVPPEQAAEAIKQIRLILGVEDPNPAPEPKKKREERPRYDRQEKAGETRSE